MPAPASSLRQGTGLGGSMPAVADVNRENQSALLVLGPRAFVAGAFTLALLTTTTAVAGDRDSGARRADTAPVGALNGSQQPPRNHDTLFGHLPPVEQNLEVVGQLEPTASQGPIVEGQIADLAVHNGFAYLMSWNEESCTKGGTYITDVRDPANPQEVGFLPAAPGYYHGEGAHVVSLDTPAFTGDLLAVNDEACSNAATRPPDVPETAGGFDLYDVTDPTNPVTFGQNFGDKTPDGSLDPDPDPDRLANSYHSVFVWQDGPVPSWSESTTPSSPTSTSSTSPTRPIRSSSTISTSSRCPSTTRSSVRRKRQNVFNHDMVVKQIDGRMVMMVSYWDAGYVQLDVTDPANPTYITDTSFDEPDSLTGFDPPEGNAHQGEFSHNSEFLLAADEDFAPDRFDGVEITTGPNAGEFPGSAISGSAPASTLADGVLNGPTYYGGYGCPDSAPVPDRATVNPTLEPGEEAILVMQRGPTDDPSAPEEACFPGEKAESAVDAGWDAVLIGNRHDGTGTANCGSGGFTSSVVAVCTTHEALHLLFGQTPGEPSPYPPGHNPAIGQAGEEISAVPQFDGWGYTHLYDRVTSEELDAFAIPESLDSRFAADFGDLSVHEFATDPTENLGYVSYYAGGIRVLRFSRADGLQQTGAWIGPNGSNFWGIEEFTTPAGERLIAGSDRDFGLVILRYTGPDAPQPPSCSDTSAITGPGEAVSVPLTCSDPNGNPLTRTIVTPPADGTLGEIKAIR